MARVSAREVFDLDWNDLDAVQRLADKMGDCVVVKYRDRPNYNIMPKRAMHMLPHDARIIERDDTYEHNKRGGL